VLIVCQLDCEEINFHRKPIGSVWHVFGEISIYNMSMRLLLRDGAVKLLVLTVVTVFFVGCTKNLTNNTDSLYVPTSADVTASATLADLEGGRVIFINNCAKCHSYYSPDSYSAANWKTIIPNMASRAGLTSTQTTLVTKYATRGK